MKRFWTVYFLTIIFALLGMGVSACAETLTLPTELTEVEDFAFFGNSALESVVLPEGLERIGSKAFASTGLTEVYLPSSLEFIADDAFDDTVTVSAQSGSPAYYWAIDRGLMASPFTFAENDDGTLTITGYTGSETALFIPKTIGGKTVTAIGGSAFSGRTELTAVTFPSSLTRIGAEAFSGCEKLALPTLHLGLREIGDRAFLGIKSYRILKLPRSLTFIGEDAFSGFRYVRAVANTYSYEWAGLYASHSTEWISLTLMPLAVIQLSTEAALKDEQVTCSAELREEGLESFRWQRKFRYGDWTDCEGADQTTLSFAASEENCGCYYRLAAQDFTGTYYSMEVYLSYLGGCYIREAYVNGTDISLGWDFIADGVTFSVYMTDPEGRETLQAEEIEECFLDVTGLEPNTDYTFRLKAGYEDKTIEGPSVIITTQNYRTGTVYRALMIGEVHFHHPSFEDLPSTIGDLDMMYEVLKHVTGPEGSPYSVVRRVDLSAEEIHSAIRSTFAEADEDDVSLFFIATHGVDDPEHEDDCGTLAAYNPGTEKIDYIRDTTLAAWLKEVPGSVVVMLASCSSGSMIYDSGEGQAAANSQALARNNAAAVSAFRAADQVISLKGETYRFNEKGERVPAPPMLQLGGLRDQKFHVLTCTRHLEDLYNYEFGSDNYSVFTYKLLQAVGKSGAMPCDTNGDGLASLNELAAYLSAYWHPHMADIEHHAQAYPANSDYALFRRDE